MEAKEFKKWIHDLLIENAKRRNLGNLGALFGSFGGILLVFTLIPLPNLSLLAPRIILLVIAIAFFFGTYALYREEKKRNAKIESMISEMATKIEH